MKKRIVIYGVLVLGLYSCDTIKEINFSECSVKSSDLQITITDEMGIETAQDNMFKDCRYRNYDTVEDSGLLFAGGESEIESIKQLAPIGDDKIPFNKPKNNFLTVIQNLSGDNSRYPLHDYGQFTNKLPVEELRTKIKKTKGGATVYLSRIITDTQDIQHYSAEEGANIESDGFNGITEKFNSVVIPIEDGAVFQIDGEINYSDE